MRPRQSRRMSRRPMLPCLRVGSRSWCIGPGKQLLYVYLSPVSSCRPKRSGARLWGGGFDGNISEDFRITWPEKVESNSYPIPRPPAVLTLVIFSLQSRVFAPAGVLLPGGCRGQVSSTCGWSRWLRCYLACSIGAFIKYRPSSTKLSTTCPRITGDILLLKLNMDEFPVVLPSPNNGHQFLWI